MAFPGDRPEADGPSGNGRPRDVSSGLSVLLVDDNQAVARAVAIALEVAGHELVSAASPEEAYSLLARRRFNAILLDLNFSPGETAGEEGMACLARILATDGGACVLALTAHSGVRIAVRAMQAGARDFVMKPWRNVELIAKIEAAVARGGTTAAAPSVSPAAPAVVGAARLIGNSPEMAAIRALVGRIAPTDASVLVRGPAGSGRSLVARALHEASRRAADAIVTVDLREGAAWDAIARADGTLVLEHVDALDVVGQSRLLRQLTGRARVVAIADGGVEIPPALRRPLATVEIEVPPLWRREGDAALLARHFALAAAERHGRHAPALTVAALDLVAAIRWPDDVRGLALAIERAVLLSGDGVIDAALLVTPAAASTVTHERPAADFSLADREKAAIEAALRRHHFNVTHAADALGLSRGALYRRMTRHGL